MIGISSLNANEKKQKVLDLLKVTDLDELKLLAGETSMGVSDLVFSLGIDNHWMVNVSYKESDSKLLSFRLFQGYVDDWEQGGDADVLRIAYPYFDNGKVIHKETR